MRRFLLLLLIAAPGAAAAQDVTPGDPVIFVHGLSHSDLAWAPVAVALRDDGYGRPHTIHADLNASEASDLAADVVVSAIVSTGRRAVPVPARSGRPDSLGTRLFFVNFRAVADAEAGTVTPYTARGAGRSESNESGVVKQGYALGLAVRDVLAATGAERVVLVGQSMGGLAVREYLQRRTADGEPAWWADPTDPESGHRVSAVVTYGTPHQGSSLGSALCESGFASILGAVSGAFSNTRSEAVRDLRSVYPCSGLGAGRYLYGGTEVETDEFDSFDVDADGAVGGEVAGLNAGDPARPYAMDNPDHPLPRDVAYVYVVGRVLGTGTDLVVDADRQVLQRRDEAGRTVLVPEGARRVITGRPHHQQTTDVRTIREVLASLDAPVAADAGG